MKKALIKSTLTMMVILPMILAFILTSENEITDVLASTKSKIKTSILLPSAKTEIVNKTKEINTKNKNIEIPKATLKPTPTPELTLVPTEEVEVVQAIPDENGVATYHGAMSGYGPDCAGCYGGGVASGAVNLYQTIYYNDSKYGPVRVLAGDQSLPFGTIVKIENSNAGTMVGIVLDRGGDIGFSGRFMFDLAFSSESQASNAGTSFNCTFKILRYGF